MINYTSYYNWHALTLTGIIFKIYYNTQVIANYLKLWVETYKMFSFSFVKLVDYGMYVDNLILIW